MYNDGELEIYISEKSLGFIVTLPYAYGSYAIFERENYQSVSGSPARRPTLCPPI